MRDLILGLALNMTWEAIEPWAVSVSRSGFSGDALLFVLPDVPQDIVSNLAELNIGVHLLPNIEFANPLVPFGQYFPYIGRFLMTYRYLTEHPYYRFVICSDVRDLVFFKNPSNWLQTHHPHPVKREWLVAAGENILHRDQPGNMEWMQKGFREVQDFLVNKEVLCSGLIAGYSSDICELALQIYLMGRELSDTIWGVDQPVYNFLMHGPYRHLAAVPTLAEGWCINLAVPATIGNFNKMIDPAVFDVQEETENGYPGGVSLDTSRFVAVHQYDRIPALAENIRRRFKK